MTGGQQPVDLDDGSNRLFRCAICSTELAYYHSLTWVRKRKDKVFGYSSELYNLYEVSPQLHVVDRARLRGVRFNPWGNQLERLWSTPGQSSRAIMNASGCKAMGSKPTWNRDEFRKQVAEFVETYHELIAKSSAIFQQRKPREASDLRS